MAALYQIVDYPNTFENYKSRDIDRCGWFAHPNEMSVRWMNVMSASRVAWAIFDGMLMLCSSQRKPRLGFLTHDGKPDGQRYTVSELAMMFFEPEAGIEYALRLLSKPEINWIRVVHQADQLVQPPDQLVHAPDQLVHELQSPADNAVTHAGLISPPAGPDRPPAGLISQPRARVKEGKGTEGKEDVHPHFGVAPHLERSSPAAGEMSFDDLTKWLNSFFPLREKRHWSCEETQLLSTLMPIPKPDRALLSWAYKLPRDKEGWAVVNNRQLSKPKQSLIALLREFSSELDKWRGVRRNLNGSQAKPDVPLPPEWIAACVKIFGPEYIPPPCIRLLPMSVELDIKRHLEREKHASAAA